MYGVGAFSGVDTFNLLPGELFDRGARDATDSETSLTAMCSTFFDACAPGFSLYGAAAGVAEDASAEGCSWTSMTKLGCVHVPPNPRSAPSRRFTAADAAVIGFH